MSRAPDRPPPPAAPPVDLLVSVYSGTRTLEAPDFIVPDGLTLNDRMKMDGLEFLSRLEEYTIPAAFFDPQYRGILDKMSYGNEGQGRGRERFLLEQMGDEKIGAFIRGIARALVPSGHLFLWIDKFHLCTGFTGWLTGSELEVVDMVTWDKGRMGMGYRTRRASEHLIVLQKPPKRAKGVWTAHDIRDVWAEKVKRIGHTHNKPVGLQGELVAAVTNPGDVVIDPAAGSFSVLEACRQRDRNFLGCDLNG